MKCELNIPTVTDPVSNIIDMLCGMKFNINEILESLQMKKNGKMGTYLILYEEVYKVFEQASTSSTKLVHLALCHPHQQHPLMSVLPTEKGRLVKFGLLHI